MKLRDVLPARVQKIMNSIQKHMKTIQKHIWETHTNKYIMYICMYTQELYMQLQA